jgi:DNA (cytosine-5)-methyltransferase 1
MIKTISLFSGSGGLDLGLLKTQRFNIVLANDFDEKACESYRFNIGNHIIHSDIRVLKNLPDADLIVGGPPCQGFSTANPNRAFDDPRNWLFKEYSRIISEVSPKVFLMENVSGILTLENGKVFNLIKNEFKNLGYELFESLLNAKFYDVPQSRNRFILVGVRNDIKAKFEFPSPVVNPPLFGRFISVGDAILNFPFKEDDPNHTISKLTELNLKRIKHIPEGGSMKDCPEELQNNSDLKRSMRRLDSTKPSYTIVHNNCDHYYHPKEHRRITIREMALLQTYPPDYIFKGSKSDQSRQVGNSVPINLGYHLGLSLVNLFESFQTKKLDKKSPILVG